MTQRLWLAPLLVVAFVVGLGAPTHAQEPTIQDQIVDSVLDAGWWDETGTISDADMQSVVERFGDEFAFAYTDRALSIESDPDQNPAALLAQSTLERLVAAGGPSTLFLVSDGHVGGASVELPFVNVMRAIGGFDRSNPEASFEDAARVATDLGDQPQPLVVEDDSYFGGVRIFILLAIITGILALLSVRSGRKKKARRVHTADARTTTNVELQKMSDLILDLDPRVTIANDPDLKERYVDASTTYRDVLEQAEGATTGHEVADLRIEIAKARWKLDVIDAELDGREPPVEPYTRDVSGSAWDSTRGNGTANT